MEKLINTELKNAQLAIVGISNDMMFADNLDPRVKSSLSEEELKNHILNELDTIYNNQASLNYIKHISQNWQNEPYFKAGYMSDYTNWRTVKKIE